jgi:ankyrin repeat protein
MQAIEWGDVLLVKRLLARGADPLARDNAGRDALALAQQRGQQEIAEQIAYHLEASGLSQPTVQ